MYRYPILSGDQISILIFNLSTISFIHFNSNKIVYYNYQTINISVYILHINFYLNMTSDFIFVCLGFSIKMTCFTNRSSRDVDPASSEFSINSFTTLKTEVITWELPNNLTVSFGNSWSDRCWTAISKVEKGALCKPKVE